MFVYFQECDFDESGFLKVKRLYDYQIADWLKKGAKILVPRNNNEYMLMQFTEVNNYALAQVYKASHANTKRSMVVLVV